MNDAKGDPASDPKTVTHTSNGKVQVMNTSNKNLQPKLLSNRTLPVIALTMHPMIDDRIVTGGGAFHTLSTPGTKEVIADAARGSDHVNRTHRHVRRTVRDGSTPGDTGISVSSTQAHFPVLI